MSHEFYGDETLFTFYETLAFSFLAISAKMIVFNVIKLSIKLRDWSQGAVPLPLPAAR
jgi:hypothetical protein